MQPTATDKVVWSVCVFVCLLVMFKSPAKMAEQINLTFVWVTWVGKWQNFNLQQSQPQWIIYKQ